MLAKRNLRLRAIEPEDLELMFRLENEADLWQWSCTAQPLSRYTLHKYIQEATGDIYTDKQLRLAITQDGQPIGFADLIDFSPRNRRAEVAVIIAPEHRQQQLGTQALLLLAEYAFRFLHLRLLYAHVATSNTPAQSAFRAAGFTESAVLQRWIETDEGEENVLIMTLASH